MMNWKESGRKQSWPNVRYYPGMYLEGLRKDLKNFGQASWSPTQDLNPELPTYETGVLIIRP
jgi:hypothetical protein